MKCLLYGGFTQNKVRIMHNNPRNLINRNANEKYSIEKEATLEECYTEERITNLDSNG